MSLIGDSGEIFKKSEFISDFICVQLWLEIIIHARKELVEIALLMGRHE